MRTASGFSVQAPRLPACVPAVDADFGDFLPGSAPGRVLTGSPPPFSHTRLTPPFCDTQWGHVGFRETATPCSEPVRGSSTAPRELSRSIPSSFVPSPHPVKRGRLRSEDLSSSAMRSRRRRVLDSARRPDVWRRHGAWLLAFPRRPGQPLPATWTTSVQLLHVPGSPCHAGLGGFPRVVVPRCSSRFSLSVGAPSPPPSRLSDGSCLKAPRYPLTPSSGAVRSWRAARGSVALPFPVAHTWNAKLQNRLGEIANGIFSLCATSIGLEACHSATKYISDAFVLCVIR